MSNFKVLGVNDSKDFCQCCGKTGLKRVVFIENVQTNEVRHFGTTCAVSPVKGFGVDREVKQAIEGFKQTQAARFAIAHRLYKQAGGKYISVDAFSAKAADAGLFEQCRQQAFA